MSTSRRSSSEARPDPRREVSIRADSAAPLPRTNLAARPRGLSLLDAALNTYGVLLVLLVVTGGWIPGGDYHTQRTLFELSQVGPWVLGFLVLLSVRLWVNRDGGVEASACLHWLRAIGGYVARTPSVVYLATVAWAIVLVAVAIRRHAAFQSGTDLAIFDQALWSTSRGDLLHSSLIAQTGSSIGDRVLFADHLVPLHLLLTPFYVVAPSPVILLVAQAVMLALGAIPLYWLARERFPGHALAALFPLAYLLYQPLREPSRYDYHAAALVPPLFLFALYFMEKARWGPMILFLVMAGLLKETLPVVGVMIGGYLFVARRKRVLGLALVGAFGLWLYVGVAWIIPAFNDGGYRHLERYGAFGRSTLSDTLGVLVHSPSTALGSLFAFPERKARYLLDLFGPVAFLPLLAPGRLALGLPFLAQNLLADSPAQTTIHSHYSVELVVFVFFSALAGATKLLRWSSARVFPGDAGRSYRWAAGLLLATSFLFHGHSEMFYLRLFAPPPHREALNAMLATVPADAAVSTLSRLAPHLAHRKTLYIFPKIGDADMPVVDFVVLDRQLVGGARGYGTNRSESHGFAAELAALPTKGYEQILDRNGLLIFRKHPPSLFGQPGDVPLVGDWTGTGWPKRGVFRHGAWRLDLNGNNRWDGCRVDACLNFGASADVPVVGDWTGNGQTKVGIFRDGGWSLDLNGNRRWDGCAVDGCMSFGLAGDVPVVGDWTGSGRTNIGVFRRGTWFLDLNGNGRWDGCGIDACIDTGAVRDGNPLGDW